MAPNSFGFDGDIPPGAIAGEYSNDNGEWTGLWFFTEAEIEEYERGLEEGSSYSAERV